MKLHRVSPLGDYTTRKEDKGDQPRPSGVDTTCTNMEGHDLAEDSSKQTNYGTLLIYETH